tara:strand:+ start:851 stop:1138 length:288 start_codon:yes stop_codon:yes gene_type:complete
MKRKHIATVEEEIHNKINANKKILENHNKKLDYLLTLINKLNDNLCDFKKNINTKFEEINTKEKILNEKLEFIQNTLQIDLDFINRSKEPCSYIS